MTKDLLALLIVFTGGVALSVQTPINAALGQAGGSGIFAAGVSFLVGFVILAVLSVSTGAIPTMAVLRDLPWWMWTGGALGAFYVWAVLTNVTQTGALSMIAALVVGQLSAALVIDAFGLLGIGVHAISWQRIAALAMVGGGLILSRY